MQRNFDDRSRKYGGPSTSSSSHGGYEDRRGTTGGYEDRRGDGAAVRDRGGGGRHNSGFEVRRDRNAGFGERGVSHKVNFRQ